jgi:hypothetical protein
MYMSNPSIGVKTEKWVLSGYKPVSFEDRNHIWLLE